MKLLLDTNALIRWHFGELKPAPVRTIERASLVCVSAVSAWEVAIKAAMGKLAVRQPVAEMIAVYGFMALNATVAHGDALRGLPLHHPDPFDRLLIAQAQEEGLTIVTGDRAFEPYRVPVYWL